MTTNSENFDDTQWKSNRNNYYAIRLNHFLKSETEKNGRMLVFLSAINLLICSKLIKPMNIKLGIIDTGLPSIGTLSLLLSIVGLYFFLLFYIDSKSDKTIWEITGKQSQDGLLGSLLQELVDVSEEAERINDVLKTIPDLIEEKKAQLKLEEKIEDVFDVSFLEKYDTLEKYMDGLYKDYQLQADVNQNKFSKVNSYINEIQKGQQYILKLYKRRYYISLLFPRILYLVSTTGTVAYLLNHGLS